MRVTELSELKVWTTEVREGDEFKFSAADCWRTVTSVDITDMGDDLLVVISCGRLAYWTDNAEIVTVRR